MCIIKFRLSFIKIAQLSIVYLHKLFGSFSIDRRFINEGIKHQYGVSICWLSTKSELLSFFFELIVCRTTFEAQHDRARILPLIPPYTRPYTGLHKTIQFSWHTFQAVLSFKASQPASQQFSFFLRDFNVQQTSVVAGCSYNRLWQVAHEYVAKAPSFRLTLRLFSPQSLKLKHESHLGFCVQHWIEFMTCNLRLT